MKTYLVTGSTGGLGLKIAEQLAEDKSNKILMVIYNIKRVRKYLNKPYAYFYPI